ncbi:MAG: tetratricopeptide repeat protein [Planctomycetota bacterium]|jgi:tetratricopeptide (TPR) repeat protein
MARIVLSVLIIVLLSISLGCQQADSGRGRLITDRGNRAIGNVGSVNLAQAGETDIVEQIAINRRAYEQGLELLIRYYTKTGNNMKLNWAEKELMSLDSIPQYKYIIEAEILESNLRASTSIPEADDVFEDAQNLEKEARVLFIGKNNDKLREALDRYDRLIRNYPTSDKIDDAAFNAGVIYEDFRDYSIALLYFRRAYQWDPETPHPARFRSARILDKRLHRNAEALELYREALNTEGKYGKRRIWVDFAEDRIKALYRIEGENN